ncbi:hypothetical protein SAMN02799630_00477 [Paenibacillus sp. UNCCL117]|uniref:N-acetylmuramoyl-L-alanine amidase n=1 Tax=Paenibacillus sp. UNCCL117 TaxID=1502764 RepID=UPI00088A62A7|nr:N-acetylmuramoyl-L-alanine amidase [Paenibacillus sp. UNCCL117]SDC39004.1 hypothetical protein SAMN04488602_10255 [Paenibacillus sp. cl123]SFW14248.1 hypothetical protein SAMN02799630_00477 [Paenibacillus sp. UNCCL117]
MSYDGILMHHSVCPSINGKGYDLFITKTGVIIPSSVPTDPSYIHICLEGDYSQQGAYLEPGSEEQWFVLGKLILRLSAMYDFPPDAVYPHSETCPGPGFPWARLVISPQDRYH